MNPRENCFVLLDDGVDASRSRLYTNYVRSLRGYGATDLPPLMSEMQQALQEGLYAVGLFNYELGEAMIGGAIRDASPATPLFEILLFSDYQPMSAQQVSAWLAQNTQQPTQSQPTGIANIHSNITEDEFEQALAQIHAHLEAGDTYQVNYTFRLRFDVFGPLLGFYTRLRQRQPVPYGALIALPDGRAVLSFSPELFIRHTAGNLTARPMKGTAPACDDPALNAQRAAALAQDSKNRAENVMIVDLLRNDLGRLAVIGSVQVPALFEVQRYSGVLQMTSTITCRIRSEINLADIFYALYPCGSITGAPKRSTMQIIRELEPDPRGMYTGGIGWFDAPEENSGLQIGDFCLSVPIRTLLLQPVRSNGVREGEMGVGAGIVYDSQAKEEYEECRLKAGFLTGLGQTFSLFETLLVPSGQGCRDLEPHLQRLAASARYFGFTCDLPEIRQYLRETCRTLPPTGQAYRLKLILDCPGEIRTEVAPLTALTSPVRLILGQRKARADWLFLQHKTTIREEYDQAWRAAEQVGAFDTLFLNEANQLAEGGRSNIFVQLDGHWYTPPLSAGVLPGIMRAKILQDPAWGATEYTLNIDDLRAAQQVVVCNSLRGALRAEIIWG